VGPLKKNLYRIIVFTRCFRLQSEGKEDEFCTTNGGEKHMRNGKQKGNDGARTNAAAMGGWLRGLSFICVVLTAAMTSPAQEEQPSASTVRFKVLLNFNEQSPQGGLFNPIMSQGTDGNLYATTGLGGANKSCFGGLGCGTVYKMTPTGALTTIYNFCSQPNCPDGYEPPGALALGTDGNFYGTTQLGGASANSGPCAPSGCGTIFKITPSGALTTLYNMCSQPNCADSGFAYSGLVLGPDGNFYGTTASGGAQSNSICVYSGCGTVYKITPHGGFTTLYNFCSQSNCSDGATPYPALAVGADGNLYGIANVGGANGAGTIFKLTLSGTLTTLHAFDGTDGGCFAFNCLAPLVQAPNGNLYGVTGAGGTGPLPGGGSAGVFFRITLSGAYTVLYNFCSLANCTDGGFPDALVYADDRNFFGAAISGGNTTLCVPYGCGTLFKITPEGILTTLHTFDGTTDGAFSPNLTQATNGIFYGTDDSGGTYNDGTIYALSVGLGPFIETLPTLGEVGARIKILGTNLTGATAVSFNGVAAGFKVISKSLIVAVVPAGATTGVVTVTTPTRSLKSNVRFRVLP
jgi:uncharacterized repeat protein (TIGR03803 family)